MNRLLGVIIFTAIEIVTLVVWLILAGVPFHGGVAAVIVLTIGIFVEHYVSVNVGAGRAPFGPLPPKVVVPDAPSAPVTTAPVA